MQHTRQKVVLKSLNLGHRNYRNREFSAIGASVLVPGSNESAMEQHEIPVITGTDSTSIPPVLSPQQKGTFPDRNPRVLFLPQSKSTSATRAKPTHCKKGESCSVRSCSLPALQTVAKLFPAPSRMQISIQLRSHTGSCSACALSPSEPSGCLGA